MASARKYGGKRKMLKTLIAQIKDVKKASILAYKEKQYKQALIFYLKYIMEKIKGK